MKKTIILASTLVALFLTGFVYAKGTPQYSLYQFKKAVENHDPDTAFKYLDLDSVVDNLATEAMNSKELNTQNSSPWETAGQSMAKGLMTLMLPSIKEAMKGQVKAAIVSSEAASEGDASKAKQEFPIKSLKKGSWSDFAVKVEGKVAIVSRKDDPSLKFKMIKTNEGNWKIAQIMIPGVGLK